MHSIIGWDCILGAWSRVEGYPCDPNPNDPLANVSSESLFNEEGRLNPSITILGEYFLTSSDVAFHATCTCTCTCTLPIIIAVNHGYFVVKMFSDSLAFAKIKRSRL